MIGVITKGRGYMVVTYALLPASILLFCAKMSEILIIGSAFPMEVYRALGGVGLIITGILCNRVSALKNSEENEFFGMNMNSWTNIFYVLGGFMLIGTGIEILAFFH
jgi:hypothetical protein